jgi:hypothetical protein
VGEVLFPKLTPRPGDHVHRKGQGIATIFEAI